MKKNLLPLYFLSLYSALLLVGGIIGYVKAASLASLICGILGSGLVGICILGILKKQSFGYSSAAWLTGIFSLFFAYRFSLSWKFMPTGLMLVLSLTTFIMIRYANRS